MTRAKGTPTTAPAIELDPCGLPLVHVRSEHEAVGSAGIAGMDPRAVVARVQAVVPPRPADTLAWGTIDGRPVLFTVDAATGRELQAAIEAGEQPSAIVEPDQVVAIDLAGR